MKNKHNPLDFIDFLFILLLTFISLFMLSLIMINPVANKAEIKSKAEFLIILDWNAGSNSDVDLWVRDPAKNIVSFREKQAGAMHLDKDDMGAITDTYRGPDGKEISVPINQEVVTLRGTMPGEYVVNAHLYRLSGSGEPLNPVTVQVVKLNPYQIVATEKLDLTVHGEEVTVVRFTVDAEGKVVSTNKTPMKFINQALTYYDSVH